MNRRGYLRWLGVAGVGVLAGCSSRQEGSGEKTGEFTPDTADYLGVAVGKLNTVALAVDTFQASDDPRDGTFDETPPRERLATAREAISEAEAVADTGQESDVEAVTHYLTVVEGTVDAVVGLLSASEGLEQTKSKVDGTDVELEPAQETMTQARNASTDAVESRERAVEASDGVDTDRLTALDAEFDAVRDGLAQLSGYVMGVDGLCGGYDDYLTGVEQLHHADGNISAEAFAEARDAFERAVSDFESAESRFAEALPVAPAVVTSELELGEQRSIALRHFSSGHVFLFDGQSVLEAATAAFEDEEYDSARESLAEGNEAALAASQEFDTGADVATAEFDEQFDTANARALELESLTDGYMRLLDAHEHLLEGERALFDGEHAVASESFQNASRHSHAADETFTESATDDGLLTEEFEQGNQRATAMSSLTDGYAHLVAGVEAIEDGRAMLDAREFDAAVEDFEEAADAFADAHQKFETGQDEAGEEFATEFTTALCQVGHLTTATAHFEAAAVAARERDEDRFETERENGEKELERAEDC